MPRPYCPPALRFWRFADASAGADGCWPWRGTIDPKGYGRIYVRGRKGLMLAHRFAWQFMVGPIPDGLDLLHSCDNPPCVNPGHLRPGTHTENMSDMKERGRANVPGRPGTSNPMAKLSDDMVREARRLRSEGWEYRRLAGTYGVSESTIRKAVQGQKWAHVR